MCLIIVKPAGVSFPTDFEEICRKAAECNDDGMGFAIPAGVYKDHKSKWKDFYETLLNMVGPEDPTIIHWRYSTSGFTDTGNCHPFQLADGSMFAHNGNVNFRYNAVGGQSDTAVMAGSIKNVYELYYQCLQLASPSNKFAILTPKEVGSDILIAGERYGTWQDGMWFSNMIWKTGRARYYDTGTYYSQTNTGLTNYNGSLKEKIAALVKQHGLKSIVESLDNYCKTMEVLDHVSVE